jgi:hypothetical protein
VEARRRLIEIAATHQPPYRMFKRAEVENQKWKAISWRHFLKTEDHEDAELSDLEVRIKAQWQVFAIENLPALVPSIHEAVNSFAAALTGGEHASVATSKFATEAGTDR